MAYGVFRRAAGALFVVVAGVAFFGDALRGTPGLVQLGGPVLLAWAGLALLVRGPAGFQRPGPEEARALERLREGHSLEDALRELLREGRRVSAIKVHRRVTGSGLAEAKRAVEALAREYPA